MSRPPAFQFYAKDWLADQRVATLTLEEKGAYIELLASAWVEGSIPADVGAIAALLRIRAAKASKVWTVLSGFFLPAPGMPGRLVNRRLEVERDALDRYRAAQAEKGRRSGEARRNSGSPPVRTGDEQRLNRGWPAVRTGSEPKTNSASASASAVPEESTEARSLVLDVRTGTRGKDERASFSTPQRAEPSPEQPPEPSPEQSRPRPGSPAAIARLFLENSRKMREANSGGGKPTPPVVGPLYGEPK